MNSNSWNYMFQGEIINISYPTEGTSLDDNGNRKCDKGAFTDESKGK